MSFSRYTHSNNMRAWRSCAASRSRVFSKLIEELVMLLGGTRTSKKKLRFMIYVSVQIASTRIDESLRPLRRVQTRILPSSIPRKRSCYGVSRIRPKTLTKRIYVLFQNLRGRTHECVDPLCRLSNRRFLQNSAREILCCGVSRVRPKSLTISPGKMYV
jgi:hypothetical protein